MANHFRLRKAFFREQAEKDFSIKTIQKLKDKGIHLVSAQYVPIYNDKILLDPYYLLSTGEIKSFSDILMMLKEE